MIIAVTSGKGGVGKTTISTNAAALLSFMGKTLIVDGDVALPNVHVMLGIESEISLTDVLKNFELLDEAIYRLEFRIKKRKGELHVLTSSTSLRSLENLHLEKFPELMEILREKYDYIVVDVAAGLSKFSLFPMFAADKIYVVVNPEKVSIEDGKKVVKAAQASGLKVSGVIVNRYKGEKNMASLAQKEIHEEIAGIVRESKLVKKSWEESMPFVVSNPSSAISKDVAKLAKNIAGMKTEIKKYGKLKYLLGLA